ncbi:DUF1330 domain-containing protein [Seohaeicola sp. SP36]|uniref:DUF1330 domain-containing protein n=1 Tax=unclassified Seohaeicola TaxID=2641111 RepID=UPI00237B10AE|nr:MULTISPECIES: DUF1330 domain-containing protein [unclassified Seohaeicola]MDD9707229.1 DUF1330 domain-containing protein [Seohaeicola sp. 4SK31]MDD9735470.1 DUF1330 domain-containing protein [Seohaeicola sp. SP36]
MTAYIIARIEVTDLEDYKTYASQTVALAEKAGGNFLVKGGPMTQVEGSGPDRHVVISFPTREQALAWYHSPEYQAILPIALRSSTRDLVIVDGI